MKITAFHHYYPKIFSSNQLIFQVIIVGWTIACLVSFFSTSTLIPQSSWKQHLPRLFSKYAITDSSYTRKCDILLPSGSLYGPLEGTTPSSRVCQLDLSTFESLVWYLGLRFSAIETRLLFEALDITGNKYISWGELTADYFNDSRIAVQTYFHQYLHAKYLFYEEKRDTPGFGFVRFASVNYTRFM